MFRLSVRAAGIAALFGVSVLCSPLVHAGHWLGWTPKKSQREVLLPNDCQFGYYGTNWRAWPEGCDRGYGCVDRFAPTVTQPMWPPSMAPMTTMPPPSWPVQSLPESPNPWSQFPLIPPMSAPLRDPQFPPPAYGPPSYVPGPTVPQSVPSTPLYPPSPPLPTAPPAAQPLPSDPVQNGQQIPLPPMPTTMVPNSRRAPSTVVPAGGWNRSVPATLSAPEFGPLSIQPMSYSTPSRSSGAAQPPLGRGQSPRNPGPVVLLRPEF